MRADVAERVRALIDSYDLHGDGVPVRLSRVEDVYVPWREDLDPIGVAAYSIPSKHGQPTAMSPAHVVINSAADRIDQRLLFAHEIGHVLCEHPGSLPHLDLGEWWHERDEREAWEVAAYLLIPSQVIWHYGETVLIAAACEVPRWLVDLRAKLYG